MMKYLLMQSLTECSPKTNWLWESTMEYKYFDTMHTNHQSLVNTIQKLCQQAQQLLEEANILTGRDYILQWEIETHISRITQTKLWQRLYKPTQFHFKDTPSSPPTCLAPSTSQTNSNQPIASTSRILTLNDTLSISPDQENQWGAMNATASPISSGTVSCMSAHCVDRDSLDMPRRTVLISTTITECEDILISKETKLVTLMENVETPTLFMYLFQNLMVQLWKLLSFFPSFHSLSQYVSYSFYSNIWIHFPHFHSWAGYGSHFWTVLPTSHSD